MSKTPESGPVPTRGIDHLAFVTDDLSGTMDFYTRVIGMRLVHVRRVPYEQDRGQPPYDNLRHIYVPGRFAGWSLIDFLNAWHRRALSCPTGRRA